MLVLWGTTVILASKPLGPFLNLWLLPRILLYFFQSSQKMHLFSNFFFFKGYEDRSGSSRPRKLTKDLLKCCSAINLTVPYFFFSVQNSFYDSVRVHYFLVFNCYQSSMVYASFPFSCIAILSCYGYLYWLQLPPITNKAAVNIVINKYGTVSGMLI